MQRSRVAFPVGLYGVLLLALCWLVLPAVFNPFGRLLLGLACLPHQWVSHAGGQPSLAADANTADQLLDLSTALRRRAWRSDVEAGRQFMPQAMEPLLCRVVAVQGRGGGGMPCELLLDRSYAELSGCADLVTSGEQLLGFLARPGVGPAAEDRLEDPARVLLLGHPRGRSVAARFAVDRPDASAGELRCVVEAAAVVDPAPLRTVLHDDPYLAAKLLQSGATVSTMRLDADWVGAVPAGLRLGRTRVWGYDTGDSVLTIGVYVEPQADPRTLAQVALWQAVPGFAVVEQPVSLADARLWPLPDGRGGRWLLSSSVSVPDGAAVVQDGVCLGTARGVAFGQALVTSFAASRQSWALWLLPDDPALAPRGYYGQVVRANTTTAWFRPRNVDAVPVAGYVFTGGGQPHCPAGLRIGPAEPTIGSNWLQITLPLRSGSQQVEVVRGPS